MKLSECKYGTIVITEDLEVGHIVGFTYNISLEHTGNLSNKEKFDRTIPLVKFPKGTRGIQHSNLKLFKG